MGVGTAAEKMIFMHFCCEIWHLLRFCNICGKLLTEFGEIVVEVRFTVPPVQKVGIHVPVVFPVSDAYAQITAGPLSSLDKSANMIFSTTFEIFLHILSSSLFKGGGHVP